MINSRLITDLTLEAQAFYSRFKAHCDQVGIKFIVTSTYRDQEAQDWLYASGRTRKGPELTKIKHSSHQDRIAWDIAIVDGNTPVWQIKVDVDQDGTPDYLEAVKVGTSLGLECGGNWKWKDWPHYQLKGVI